MAVSDLEVGPRTSEGSSVVTSSGSDVEASTIDAEPWLVLSLLVTGSDVLSVAGPAVGATGGASVEVAGGATTTGGGVTVMVRLPGAAEPC